MANDSASRPLETLDQLIAEMRHIAIVAGQCSVEGPSDTASLMAGAESARASRWADELLRLRAADVQRQVDHTANAWCEVADEIERARQLAATLFDDLFPDWFWPRVEMLRSASRQTPTPAGWQPIETAPKDADVLLLTDGDEVSFGGWLSAADQGAEPDEEFRIAAGWWVYDGFDMKPTHWMPLPSPPRASRHAPAETPEKEQDGA